MSEYYSETDPRNVEPHFSKHMNAMTTECLESKGDIAIELAVRDRKIERLRAALEEIRYKLGADNATAYEMRLIAAEALRDVPHP